MFSKFFNPFTPTFTRGRIEALRIEPTGKKELLPKHLREVNNQPQDLGHRLPIGTESKADRGVAVSTRHCKESCCTISIV
jgi:hypothetical protein